MLDVDSPRPSPPPPAQPIRSMLDVDSPPSPAVKQVLSNPGSPTDPNFRAHMQNQTVHPRSLSDAASRPADFGPRASGSSSRHDPTSDYQFSGIITHHVGQALPKRVSQGGKRASGSMAEVMRGNDVGNLLLSGDRGRHYSIAGPSSRLNNKSKSPQSRLEVRSSSPHGSLLSGRHLSPAGRQLRAESQQPEYQNAYRHLSDANIARFGGSLSEFTRRKRSDDATNLGRLEKDYLSPDGELLPDDSSDDQGGSSSDEGNRGRKAARSFNSSPPGNGASSSGGSQSPESTRKTRSMMAAAEEERMLHPPCPFYCQQTNTRCRTTGSQPATGIPLSFFT